MVSNSWFLSTRLVAKIVVSNKDSGATLGYMRGATVNTATYATTFSFRNPSSASDLVELNDYVCHPPSEYQLPANELVFENI